MQYKKFSLLFYFSLLVCITVAQQAPKHTSFISPIDFPIFLSGNYGEIRTSHFHAGIDIKTQGAIGKKIYSTEDGYISRIKISSGGYGKTLYITHPNGYTTVYGHLNNFTTELDNFIKALQYENNDYEINYFPEKHEFQVKKGDVIAFSGNTGSSKGPHLHFEIRKTDSQIPVNPLLYNFDIKDNIAPRFYSVNLYPLAANSSINSQKNVLSYKTTKKGNQFGLIDSVPIKLWGKIGIGIEINDFLNGSRNKCGIYALDLIINNDTIYSHEINNISFNETGYIKSHIDYKQKINSKKSIQKTFIAPNNNLSIYKKRINNGIYDFNTDSIYSIKIVTKDAYNNTSILYFNTKGEQPKPDLTNISEKNDNTVFMDWEVKNTFSNDEISVNIPANALYDTLHFSFSKSPKTNKSVTPIYNIHKETVPIQKKLSLSINIDKVENQLRNKAFIAYIDSENEIEPIGGEIINNSIVSEANYFGKYTVMLDTVNPEIEPILKEKKILIEDIIMFTIKDDLSGIKSYNAYIDNNWALFEYDLKNDLIFYTIDDKRLKKNIEHELELFVIDNTGNLSTYYTTFFW